MSPSGGTVLLLDVGRRTEMRAPPAGSAKQDPDHSRLSMRSRCRAVNTRCQYPGAGTRRACRTNTRCPPVWMSFA